MLTACLGLALTASAAPTEAEAKAALGSRTTGDFTYYNTGLGACGWVNYDSDLVAAVGHGLFDRERPCGRTARIHYNSKSLVVNIVDRCGGCADTALDLSPTAFRKLVGTLGPGRVQGTWEFT
jgi:hypothetical protein